jgi:hypothetical protein
MIDKYNVGLEVLAAVSMKTAVLWVVAPCSLVDVSEDAGIKHHRNVGKHSLGKSSQQPIKQSSQELKYSHKYLISRNTLRL